MKTCVLVLCIASSLTGCGSSVSEADVEALQVRIQQLETSVTELQDAGLASEAWVGEQGFATEDWVIGQFGSAVAGLDDRLITVEQSYVTTAVLDGYVRRDDFKLWNHGEGSSAVESYTYGLSLKESDAELWKAMVLRPEYDTCRAILVAVEASLGGGVYDAVRVLLKASAEAPSAGSLDAEIQVPLVAYPGEAFAITQQFWVTSSGLPLWVRLTGADSTDMEIEVRQLGCLR